MSSKVPEMVATGRLPNTRAKTLDRHAEWWELRRQGYTIYTIAARFGVSHQAVSKAMLAMEEKLYKVLAEQSAPMRASQTAILEANLERALLEWFKSQDNAQSERLVEKSVAPVSKDQETQAHGGSLTRRQVQTLEEEVEGLDYESIPGYFYDEKTGEETLSEDRARLIGEYLIAKLKAGVGLEGLIERTLTNTSQGQCGDPRYLAEIRANLADIRKIWGLDAPVKQEFTGKDGGPVNIAFADSLGRVYGTEES